MAIFRSGHMNQPGGGSAEQGICGWPCPAQTNHLLKMASFAVIPCYSLLLSVILHIVSVILHRWQGSRSCGRLGRSHWPHSCMLQAWCSHAHSTWRRKTGSRAPSRYESFRVSYMDLQNFMQAHAAHTMHMNQSCLMLVWSPCGSCSIV